MTNTYKILGQSNPAATTATAAYTVPASTSAVISSITICNRDSSDHTFRIFITDNVGSINAQEYIAYGASVAANDSVCLTLGITLPAAKIVGVYADAQQLSFGVFGVEITA